MSSTNLEADITRARDEQQRELRANYARILRRADRPRKTDGPDMNRAMEALGIGERELAEDLQLARELNELDSQLEALAKELAGIRPEDELAVLIDEQNAAIAQAMDEILAPKRALWDEQQHRRRIERDIAHLRSCMADTRRRAPRLQWEGKA
jgi:hypothetical protein